MTFQDNILAIMSCNAMKLLFIPHAACVQATHFVLLVKKMYGNNLF